MNPFLRNYRNQLAIDLILLVTGHIAICLYWHSLLLSYDVWASMHTLLFFAIATLNVCDTCTQPALDRIDRLRLLLVNPANYLSPASLFIKLVVWYGVHGHLPRLSP